MQPLNARWWMCEGVLFPVLFNSIQGICKNLLFYTQTLKRTLHNCNCNKKHAKVWNIKSNTELYVWWDPNKQLSSNPRNLTFTRMVVPLHVTKYILLSSLYDRNYKKICFVRKTKKVRMQYTEILLKKYAVCNWGGGHPHVNYLIINTRQWT